MYTVFGDRSLTIKRLMTDVDDVPCDVPIESTFFTGCFEVAEVYELMLLRAKLLWVEENQDSFGVASYHALPSVKHLEFYLQNSTHRKKVLGYFRGSSYAPISASDIPDKYLSFDICAQPVIAILSSKRAMPESAISHTEIYGFDQLSRYRDQLSQPLEPLVSVLSKLEPSSDVVDGSLPSATSTSAHASAFASPKLVAQMRLAARVRQKPPLSTRQSEIHHAATRAKPLQTPSPYYKGGIAARIVRYGRVSAIRVASLSVDESSPLRPKNLQTSFLSTSVVLSAQKRDCLSTVFRCFFGAPVSACELLHSSSK